MPNKDKSVWYKRWTEMAKAMKDEGLAFDQTTRLLEVTFGLIDTIHGGGEIAKSYMRRAINDVYGVAP